MIFKYIIIEKIIIIFNPYKDGDDDDWIAVVELIEEEDDVEAASEEKKTSLLFEQKFSKRERERVFNFFSLFFLLFVATTITKYLSIYLSPPLLFLAKCLCESVAVKKKNQNKTNIEEQK